MALVVMNTLLLVRGVVVLLVLVVMSLLLGVTTEGTNLIGIPMQSLALL
jgi:hypothetical protein